MKKLERKVMKNLMGGRNAGGCLIVISTSGQSSCWYSSSGNGEDLCLRVYGDSGCQSWTGSVNCATNNCAMN